MVDHVLRTPLRERRNSGVYLVANLDLGFDIQDLPVAHSEESTKAGQVQPLPKLHFKAGSNAINAAVSSTSRIIRASSANINITEAVN